MSTALDRPSNEQLRSALRFLEPWRVLTAPKAFGLDTLPAEGPVLFVGNHTLFGVLDAPMMYVLLNKRDIFPRALGHHVHFKLPMWRELITRYGVVDGTRDNCAKLMEAREHILVYPGGSREVAKRRGEKYRIIWKERIGFVRMAVRFGCPIVPFSALGVEDAYDILVDADDLQASPLGPLIRRLGIPEDMILPIARGVGPTPLPRPHRLYFRFGEAISTSDVAGQDDNTELCRSLRDRVKADIEFGIEWLRAVRRDDPKRKLIPRIWSELRKLAAQS